LNVSGNHASRVFDVSAEQVSISGLTVADGLATGRQALGGGLLNSGGGQVNLTEVTFTNNLARGDTGPNPIAGGGAVANVSGGALTIVASTFTGNQSFGPYWGVGGAILNDTGSALSVADTLFTDNRATGLGDPTFLLGGDGGAIANLGDSSAAIFHSTFTGNQARGIDGAPGQDAGFASGGAIESAGVSLLGNKGGRPVLTIAR